jgi:hypothetical protein
VKSTTTSAPASGQRRDVVARVDARHELQVVGGLDRGADLLADLAERAEHSHLERHGAHPIDARLR